MRLPDIRPFRALRYSPAAGDLSDLFCPPYDAVRGERREALLARSPHNAVALELPEPEDDLDRYQAAARRLARWRATGILAADSAPALYRHDHAFEWMGHKLVRRGFLARVRLEPPGDGVIRPHEETFAGPRSDRTELLRALRVATSPVFAVYRSDSTLTEPAGPPLGAATLAGETHRLWAIDSPAAMRDLVDQVGGSLTIADGHHRYAAALALRDELRARAASWSGEEAENFVLMELVPTRDLLVRPIHRLLSPEVVPPDLLARLAPFFRIEDAGADAVGRLAEAGARVTAFVLLGPERAGRRLLTLRDRAAIEALLPAGRSPAWRALDTAVLETVLVRVVGLDEGKLAAGVLRYTPEAGEAALEVEEGRAGVAFLLNPTPVERVLAVAEAGERMPQKSTWFHPKLPTGLVFYPFDLP